MAGDYSRLHDLFKDDSFVVAKRKAQVLVTILEKNYEMHMKLNNTELEGLETEMKLEIAKKESDIA